MLGPCYQLYITVHNTQVTIETDYYYACIIPILTYRGKGHTKVEDKYTVTVTHCYGDVHIMLLMFIKAQSSLVSQIIVPQINIKLHVNCVSILE